MRYLQVEQIAKCTFKEPDKKFRSLMLVGRRAVRRGYFTKSEFISICRWKSARRIALCESNAEQLIKDQTGKALAETDERNRIVCLLKLDGVAVPTASAILAVSLPHLYGVIDIRAWQLLHSLGAVSANSKGVNLSVANWLEFLKILRSVAFHVKTTPRLVDISLYMAHKKYKASPLYAKSYSKLKKLRPCISSCKSF